MKKVLLSALILLSGVSCQNQEQEQQLRQREASLTQREQALQLREQDLVLREQRLTKATQVLDSSSQQPADSTLSRLVGAWATRMECTETNCPGSAIGDTKNERWQISYAQQAVQVLATFNNKVVRTYSGTIAGNTLELTAQHPANDTLADAAITVRLSLADNGRLEGRREINRAGCRILYALTLTRETATPAR